MKKFYYVPGWPQKPELIEYEVLEEDINGTTYLRNTATQERDVTMNSDSPLRSSGCFVSR